MQCTGRCTGFTGAGSTEQDLVRRYIRITLAPACRTHRTCQNNKRDRASASSNKQLGGPVDPTLSADQIIRAIKSAGIRFIVALPDRTTSEHLLKPMLKDPDFQVVQVCKEDEGVSICCGLYAAGHRSLLLMQHTGLLDSVNNMRGSAVEGKNPVCMMVGLLQMEPGLKPTQSKRYGLRIVEPVLDAMQIEHHLMQTDDDIEAIGPAIEKSYATETPVVLLVGTEPK